MAIQVKALNSMATVPVGGNLDKVGGDYWIVVTNVKDSPTAFVMLSDEVKWWAGRAEMDGRAAYWLVKGAYGQDCFRDRWDRVSLGNK